MSAQRERIMGAMVATVAEKGYGDATVADVIDRAGVSRATFYELFADKEECFLAAYDTLIEALLEYVTAAYESADQWPDRIRIGLDALLRFLAASPAAARVTILEVLAATPTAHERYRAAIQSFNPFLEDGRRFAPPGTELPENLAQVAVGGVATIVTEEILADRAASLPEVLPDVVYMTLVPFLGHERAAEEKRRASEPRSDAED